MGGQQQYSPVFFSQSISLQPMNYQPNSSITCYNTQQIDTSFLNQNRSMSSSSINNNIIIPTQQIQNDNIQDKNQNAKYFQNIEIFKDNWIQPYLHIKQIRRLLFSKDNSCVQNKPDNLLEFQIDQLFHFKNLENDNIIYPSMPTRDEYLKRVEKLKLQPKQSKFHNKAKVLINKITKFFLNNNLKCLNIPEKLYKKIIQFIERVRCTGRAIVKNVIRNNDLYNHHHFQLLFLTITASSLQFFDNKDLELHQEIFGIDIKLIDQNNAEQNDKLLYINFLKRCIFEIINLHLKKTLIGEDHQKDEREYEIRVFAGITEMIQGNQIRRF